MAKMEASDKVLLLLVLLLSPSLFASRAKANLGELLKPKGNSNQSLSSDEEDDGFEVESVTIGRKCVDIINSRRHKLGLNKLEFDDELALIAKKRADLLADGAFAKTNSRSIEYWEKDQSFQNMDQSNKKRGCSEIINDWCRRSEVNSSRQYLESRDDASNCPYVVRASSHRVGCAQVESSTRGSFTVCQFNKPASEQLEMAPLQFQDEPEAGNSDGKDETPKPNVIDGDEEFENEKEEGLHARMLAPDLKPDVEDDNGNEECHFSLTRDWDKLSDDEKRSVLKKAINWFMRTSGMNRLERIMLKTMISKHDGGLVGDL